MIEAAENEQFEEVTYRYISEDRSNDILKEMGLDPAGAREMLSAAGMVAGGDADRVLLDSVFITNPSLPPAKTRFSDGTVRVFYSALEQQTAAHEAWEWYMRNTVIGAKSARNVFYVLTAWNFSGVVKDLRPLHKVMPFLTQRDDRAIEKCNEVAVEANASGLDGLLSPSAAIENGTCLPVFQRRALTKCEYRGLEQFTVEQTGGVLKINPVS